MPIRTERGSASIELIILAPFLLAIMLLIAAFGRHDNVVSAVSQAATDAARSATAARSVDTAKTAADDSIGAALDSTPQKCQDTADVTVSSTDNNDFTPSDPFDPQKMNFLTVTVSCDVDMSDLSFIGFGSMTITEKFTSPMPADYGVY